MIFDNQIKLHGNDLAISREMLVLAIGSRKTVESAITRKQITTLERGWYSFDSMKSCGWSEKVLLHLGFLSKVQLKEVLEKENEGVKQVFYENIILRLPTLWARFYRVTDAHYYQNTHLVEPKKSLLLASSVSVYRFLDGTRFNKAELVAATGFEKRECLYKGVITLMKGTEKEPGMDLPLVPQSYDRLRADVDNFGKFRLNTRVNELDWFADGRKGNTNSMVIGKPTGTYDDILIEGTRINMAEWHANTLAILYMNPGKANKFDFEELYFRYSKRCTEHKIEAESLSSVKRFLSQEAVQTYMVWERHGYETLDKLLPSIRGKKPMYSLNKCGIDGFQVDFRTDTGEASIMLTAVVIVDYLSEAVSGFAIGFTEVGKLVRDAYRMHLALNGGKTYNEIEFDGSMANNSEKTRGLLEQMCKKVHVSMSDDPTGKHRSNSKSRNVERFLQEINRNAQSMPGWKGTNVNRIDKNRKPNPDYMKGNAVQGLEVGIMQVKQLINVYNNQKLEKFKGMSRAEAFDINKNPEAETIDVMTQSRLLLERRIETVRGGLIAITVNKKVFEYQLNDWYTLRPKMGKGDKVIVYMDETDMSSIDVWGWNVDREGNPVEINIGTIKELSRAYRDAASQTPEDLEKMGKQLADRKRMLGGIERKQLEIEAKAYGLDLSLYPDLKELKKAVNGARMTQDIIETHEKRFETELKSDNAKQVDWYFEDRMRENDMRVPVPVENEASKKLSEREKYERLRNIRFD
jgi:hypothetical protein